MKLRYTFAAAALTALCLLSPHARATTYYVDQSAGNDQNGGTSSSTAWRNAPGMSAYAGSGSLTAGDQVLFDRADTWTVTGTQGLYLVGGVTYVGNSWGAGSGRATIKAGATLDVGVVRFRDHPSVPTVFRGFDVHANNQVANGIDINHRYWSLMNGAMKTIDDVVVHDVYCRQTQGQYKYGIIVSNHGGSAGVASNVEILNSTVYNTCRDAINLYPGDENKDTYISNITVRGNTAHSTGTDPNYCCGAGVLVKGRVEKAVVERNYIRATKGAGIFLNSNETNAFGIGMSDIHVRYNVVNVDTVHGSIRIYDGSVADPKQVYVYGNLVYGNTKNAGLLLDSDVRGTNRLYVYNNSFYQVPVVINTTAGSFPTFEFFNNVIYTTGATPLSDRNRITAHGNNLYYGSGTLVSTGGATYSVSNLTAYEPTGLASNPQFLSPTSLPDGFTGGVPNRDGLSLVAGSPAVDSGATMTTAFSSSINGVVRSGKWDRGAYESGTAALQKPNPPSDVSAR